MNLDPKTMGVLLIVGILLGYAAWLIDDTRPGRMGLFSMLVALPAFLCLTFFMAGLIGPR